MSSLLWFLGGFIVGALVFFWPWIENVHVLREANQRIDLLEKQNFDLQMEKALRGVITVTGHPQHPERN